MQILILFGHTSVVNDIKESECDAYNTNEPSPAQCKYVRTYVQSRDIGVQFCFITICGQRTIDPCVKEGKQAETVKFEPVEKFLFGRHS